MLRGQNRPPRHPHRGSLRSGQLSACSTTRWPRTSNTLAETFHLEGPIDYTAIRCQTELLAAQIRPLVCDTSKLLADAMAAGKRVLFEGAQGTMLDIDHGTYPFVTSSSATAGGACTGLGVPPTRIQGVIGVSKAYITRVGTGPFPTREQRRGGRPAATRRKRIRVGHRPAAALRLVRRAAAALHRDGQRLRFAVHHQAGRAGPARQDSGVRRVLAGRQGSRGYAGHVPVARRRSSRCMRSCRAGRPRRAASRVTRISPNGRKPTCSFWRSRTGVEIGGDFDGSGAHRDHHPRGIEAEPSHRLEGRACPALRPGWVDNRDIEVSR